MNNSKKFLPTLKLNRVIKDFNYINGNLSYKLSLDQIKEFVFDNEFFKDIEKRGYSLTNFYSSFLNGVDREIKLETLELPWINNQRNISCIRSNIRKNLTENNENKEEFIVNEYIITKHKSNKFGENCFKIWELDEKKYEKFKEEQLETDYFFPQQNNLNFNLIKGVGSLRDYFIFNSLNKDFVNQYGQILKEVSGRDNILIHCGNTISNTEGCILVGLNKIRNGSLISSRIAMDILQQTLPDVCKLIIN